MRVALVAMCLSAMVLCSANSSIQNASAAANVGVGDYWEYRLISAEYESLEINGTITLKIEDTKHATVAGSQVDAYNCSLTGTGSLGGTFNDTPTTGVVSFAGEQIRLVSNFSIVSQIVEMRMNLDSIIGDIHLNFTAQDDFTPPFDDYIGDNSPAALTTVTCNSSTVGVGVMQFAIPPLFPGLPWFYYNDTFDIDEALTYEMRVVDTGVSVVTEAGTFECFQVNGTTTADGVDSYETIYYSEEVGNYVKYEGTDITGGMLSEGMILISYSHGSDGASTESMLVLSAVVIAVVIVAAVILILLVLRRKKGPEAQTYPEPPQAPPPQ